MNYSKSKKGDKTTTQSDVDDFQATVPQNPQDFAAVDRTTDFRYQISLLSDYPRVKASIESLWGSARCREYLFGLVIDNRPGRYNSRVKGFPPIVYEAVNNLCAIHDNAFPKHIPKYGVWDEIV